MKMQFNKGLSVFLVLAVGAGVFLLADGYLNNDALPEGFASGNGRIEAVESDVATKLPGRVVAVLVQEGDAVKAGQVLAKLDTRELDARMRQAEAGIEQARQSKKLAQAMVIQRKSEQALVEKNLQRAQNLYENKSIALVQLQQSETAVLSAGAGVAAANAQVVMQAAAVNAAIAQMETIQTNLNDSVLRAPANGRVLYRLVEPGGVIGMGGRVLTTLDLSNVYMNLYLPTSQVGKIAIGAEATIVLDARPESPIPAKVIFISPTAQFTPREIETLTEREKLMFRVKVKIDTAYLSKHSDQVKTGLPSMAYIRLDKTLPWPENLRVKR